MVRASSLFIVVVISMVLASITSAIVFFSYYYKIEVYDLLHNKRLHANLNSAITILKATPSESLKDSITFDLYNQGQDSVTIKVQPWGIYELAQVEAFQGKSKIAKTFLFGYTLDKESKAALCLNDSDRGLRVSGKTEIVGDCYLPQGVVKSASIDGTFYQGPSKIVDGQINKSTLKNIPLHENIVSYLDQLLQTAQSNFQQESGDTNSIRRAFQKPTYVIDYDQLDLSSLHAIEGHVLLYSRKPVRVSNSLFLKDVILVAPSVIFQENYKGNLQVVCTDSIIVEKGSSLSYPSALVLVKNKNTTGKAFIQVQENVTFKGVICAYSKFVNEENVIVNLDKGSMVHGQVYSNAYVSVQGTVHGGVLCNKLLSKTKVSINENCLVDATINVHKRSPYFIGSRILPVSQKRGIVKWF